jgi:hypothetical protein
MAGVPHRTGNILYWDYFQGRGGKSKRPFLILWPVQILCSAAPAERRDREFLEERALWIGWIHYTKSTLGSIKKLAQLSQDRFSEKELGKHLYHRMTEDICKTDLYLNGLLNYFQVTTPVKKTNTVNTLIEEVLKKNHAQMEGRGVRPFKRFEKNLPEIIVPDEQLTYILNSVLQYVIMSTRPNGNIECLTKSIIFQGDSGETQVLFEKYGGYIEISVAFVRDKEPAEQSPAASGRILTRQKDEALELMLRLVKGIVLRNWGKMNLETDKKREKTIISLRFPLERRKVFFYEPIAINPSARELKIPNIWE